MARKSVKSIEYVGEDVDHGGYSFLELKIDGDRVARVYTEQPMARAGLIFLGAEFEDDYEAVLPADPRNSRFDDEVRPGATDHPEVLRLYWEWWFRVNGPNEDMEPYRRRYAPRPGEEGT